MGAKRGRPPKSMTQEQVSQSRVHIEKDRDEVAHSPNRPPRVTAGIYSKLDHYKAKDPNYYYYWVADKPGKIQQKKAAYYEHVMDNGVAVEMKTSPYDLYLMRLPIEYRQEDEKLKAERVSATIQKKQELSPGEYLPDGRHHAIQKDNYDPLA